MSTYFIGFAIIIAAVDWFAVVRKWKKLEYFAKPGVILILIIWLIIINGYQGPTLFFLFGLIFSLAGDIFLMLPEEKFLAGLISFLGAHLAYIGGFTYAGFHFSSAGFLIIILVAVAGFILLWQILKGLRTHQQEKLRFPVIIYAVVICLMLVSALTTLSVPDPVWKFYPAVLVSFGAILFFISDITLAWNKFVNPVKYGSLLIIITYHIAQITITLGSGLNFLT